MSKSTGIVDIFDIDIVMGIYPLNVASSVVKGALKGANTYSCSRFLYAMGENIGNFHLQQS